MFPLSYHSYIVDDGIIGSDTTQLGVEHLENKLPGVAGGNVTVGTAKTSVFTQGNLFRFPPADSLSLPFVSSSNISLTSKKGSLRQEFLYSSVNLKEM